MDLISIKLKEYETIRQEILITMQVRNSILSFGLAILGAVLTVSIALASQSSLVSSLILILIAPAICIFVIYMWLGEYQRMQRAGKFLMNLEQEINEDVSANVLTWETSLRSQRTHMKYPYNTTVLLLTVIGLMSMTIGIVILQGNLFLKSAVELTGIAVHVGIYLHAVSNMAKLRI
jgi:hypothetical protein